VGPSLNRIGETTPHIHNDTSMVVKAVVSQKAGSWYLPPLLLVHGPAHAVGATGVKNGFFVVRCLIPG